MVQDINKSELVNILERIRGIKNDLDSINSRMESYYGEKSEKWQESYKGEIYAEKKYELEEVMDFINEGLFAMEYLMKYE